MLLCLRLAAATKRTGSRRVATKALHTASATKHIGEADHQWGPSATLPDLGFRREALC